tara:strand:- start:550 stop:714 length:165 start_codon:yes stop_codon:yes gene_type:complete
MKPVIICGLLLIATFSIIVFDFGRRVVECRELNDSLTIRLADINENYWLFKREP